MKAKLYIHRKKYQHGGQAGTLVQFVATEDGRDPKPDAEIVTCKVVEAVFTPDNPVQGHPSYHNLTNNVVSNPSFALSTLHPVPEAPEVTQVEDQQETPE